MFIDDSTPPAEAGGVKSSVMGNGAGSGQLVHMSGASNRAVAGGNGGGGAFGRGSGGFAGGLGTGGLIQANTGGGARQDPYYRCVDDAIGCMETNIHILL